MNTISPARRTAISGLLIDGESIRAVAAAKNTISRLRAALRDAGLLPELCICGREAGHNGWCRPRLERSPRRQEVLAGLHDRRRKRGGSKVLVEIRHIPTDHGQKAAVLDALPRIDVPAVPFEPSREAEMKASHDNRRRRALARRFKDRPAEDLATILARSGPVVIKRLPPGHHGGWLPSWFE